MYEDVERVFVGFYEVFFLFCMFRNSVFPFVASEQCCAIRAYSLRETFIIVCLYVTLHCILTQFFTHFAEVIPLEIIKGLKKLSDSCQATRHMGDYDKIQPLLKHILVKLKHCG